MSTNLNGEYSDLRLLYQINIDNIENAKNRQWRTTYYVLAVFAAIIGFCQLGSIDIYAHGLGSKVICLLIPAFLFQLLGTYHVLNTHKIQCEYRNKIIAIESQFIGKAKEVVENIDTEDGRDYRKYSYYLFKVVLPFYIMMLIGFCFVAWVVLLQEAWYIKLHTIAYCLISIIAFIIFNVKYWKAVEIAVKRSDELEKQ